MEFTKQRLKDQLSLLVDSHKAVFGASCCERLVPNYERFASDVRWGDSSVLRRSLNVVWSAIEENTPLDLIDATSTNKLIDLCESVTPDTEDFTSRFTSAALDAATSVVELLQFSVDRSLHHIADISTLSFDSVDMYVQGLLDIDYSASDFESRIRAHPLMVKEVTKQMSDLAWLRSHPSVDGELVAFLRNQVSNLEI